MIGENNKNKLIKEKEAFTLIEVLVSVVLFTLIIVSVTGIFKLSIDGQRNAIATQNVQESLKYFLELTAKEMRMAQKDKGQCGGSDTNGIFFVSSGGVGNILAFKNVYGECVSYYLTENGGHPRFTVERHLPGKKRVFDFISPAKIEIHDLRFILKGADPSAQPMVTINLRASAYGDNKFDSDMTLQTSVTSRYYK